MSAPNFSLRNAKRYFVLPEEYCEDNFDWQDILNELHEIALDKDFEELYNEDLVREIEHQDFHSSYPSTTIPCVYEDHAWGLGDWRVDLFPLVRSGYWNGACLDFAIRIVAPDGDTLWNEDALNKEYVRGLIEEYAEMLRESGEPSSKEDADNLFDKLQGMIKNAIEKFYIFAEATSLEEIVRMALFSNGEAIYRSKKSLERALKKEA